MSHDEKQDRMYAGMNMAITEEDLREIAPYLEAIASEAKPEAKAEIPKPETSKSTALPEKAPTITPPARPLISPNGNGHKPEVTISFKADRPIHYNVFQRINRLANRFGESVSAFLKRLRKFLFGK